MERKSREYYFYRELIALGSDGSASKTFGSIFVARVGSASMVWVWVWKISPKNLNFYP